MFLFPSAKIFKKNNQIYIYARKFQILNIKKILLTKFHFSSLRSIHLPHPFYNVFLFFFPITISFQKNFPFPQPPSGYYKPPIEDGRRISLSWKSIVRNYDPRWNDNEECPRRETDGTRPIASPRYSHELL